MPDAQPFEVSAIPLPATAQFPNNESCPVLLYQRAFESDIGANRIEQTFASHGWTNGWRAGVYSTHHYHSTAHEVLGCFAGSATIQLGGADGPLVELTTGDAIVIPAGVAHKKLSSTSDFCVVGAYAGGRSYDMNYGGEDERAGVTKNIAELPLPGADPIRGRTGPLLRHWR